MPINPLISNIFIDSCAFDPKYYPENNASAEIFKLYRAGKLRVQIAHSTKKEIAHPHTPSWVKNEANALIYTIDVQLTPEERNKLENIEKALAGNGNIDTIRQDARHIFEADKYSAGFITTDSLILKRADVLPINVSILLPSKYLDIVKRYLEQNNNINIQERNTAIPQKTINTPSFYKNYLIQPAPYQLTETGMFTTHFYIRRDNYDNTKEKGFDGQPVFNTKEDAVTHCINAGKEIIDGKIKNCTVDDL